MILYSPATESFLKKIKQELRSIMNNEMGLQFKRSRFLFAHSSVPLHLVCFEGTRWAYFDSLRYQIALNKHLMYMANREVIRNILRHELAHLITFYVGETGPVPMEKNFEMFAAPINGQKRSGRQR